MDGSKVKKKRAPTALTIPCAVCGSPAPDHVHFGGHCCYSCRAFFRRTIERMEKTEIVCRTGIGKCEVSEMSKACSACRYDKCLEVGMKSDLLQGKRKKKHVSEDNKDSKAPKMRQQEMTSPGPADLVQRFRDQTVPDYAVKDEIRTSLIKDDVSWSNSFQSMPTECQKQFSERQQLSKSLYTYPCPQPYYNQSVQRKLSLSKNEEIRQFSFARSKSFHETSSGSKNELKTPIYPQSHPFDLPSGQVFSPRVETNKVEVESNIQHQSVIRGPSVGVIKSPTRPSVIHHGPSQSQSPDPPHQRRSVYRDELDYLSHNGIPANRVGSEYQPYNHVGADREEIHPRPQNVEERAYQIQNSTPENRDSMYLPLHPIQPLNNSSVLLRYEANMMKYQADMCRQQSQVLNFQARMMEHQEQARQALMTPYHSNDDNYNPSRMNYQRSSDRPDFSVQRQESNQTVDTNHVGSTKNNYQSVIPESTRKIKVERDDSSKLLMSVTDNNSFPMGSMKQQKYYVKNGEDQEQTEQLNLKKDIKNMLKHAMNRTPLSFDSKIFQSQIFQEAEDLLSNSPFNNILMSMSEDAKHHKKTQLAVDCLSLHPSPSQTSPLSASSETVRVVLSKQGPVHFNISECRFTDEELNWTQKIYTNISKCTKTMMRPTVPKAMIDCWRGAIDQKAMMTEIAKGRPAQAYMHILIMSNLPYFGSLSSSAQRHLMKSNGSVCSELMTAAFFFAHDNAKNILDQEATCGLMTNFSDYIKRDAPYAATMPAIPYTSFYKSPWAATLDDEEKHMRSQRLVGESMRGRDRRIIALLYTLAFYSMTDIEFSEVDLSGKDKQIIKKAQDHLGVIYRRFLKQQHGCRAASGYALSHIYYLSILKENVKIGRRTTIPRPKVKLENSTPEDPLPIPSEIARPELLEKTTYFGSNPLNIPSKFIQLQN